MKIKYFLLIIMLCASASTFGQEQQQQTNIKNTGLYKHYQMKYVFGMKYNDWRVASNALYDLITLDPSDDSLKMNLSYLYLENNVFASALFVSSDVLARQPENLQALQVSAISYENMGLANKAIESYEKLYLLTDQMDILYNLAAMQFESGRITEAKTNAEIVAENPKSDTLKLSFSTGQQNQQQEVQLVAAAYNLLGLIEKEQGNTEQAKGHFNKALEIEPEFAIAKKSLGELE